MSPDSPVTFANSSTICSFVLLLGMEPTNSLLLATEMHTPICLPGRISLLLHCRGMEVRLSKGQRKAGESTDWSLCQLDVVAILHPYPLRHVCHQHITLFSRLYSTVLCLTNNSIKPSLFLIKTAAE